MDNTLTDAIQDYLKSIYNLTENGKSASTSALAIRLGIAPGSVSGMLQKLAAFKPPLVLYHKHQGVKLTTRGRRAALEVIRHHRLLESWLVQNLGYSWDEVHAEAEKLEHVISEEFEARIAAVMGNPMRDPHGELIPSKDLRMPQEDANPLSSLLPGQVGIIQRVKTDDGKLLRYLEERGLTPGKKFEVLEYSQFDNNITIRAGRKVSILGLNISTKIFINRN